MNKRRFEATLFRAIKAYEKSDADPSTFQWVMDDLSMTCTDEQWHIVDDTMRMLREPDYIDRLERGELRMGVFEVNPDNANANPLCPECGCLMAAVSRGYQCEDCTREMLGKEVRRVWIEHCLEIGDYKPSHLTNWDKLDEQDKEVDRRIGEAIMKMVIKKRLSYVD